MIDFLRGHIVHREADYLVLDVHGVGYRLFCVNPHAIQQDVGKEITLFAHHNVREDAVTLFGFQSREEQTLFRRLLIVSGIGPRVALGILSFGRPEAIVSAIYQEDIDFLVKLPGIGRKTAQRIVLDLKDKLADLPMQQATSTVLAGNSVSAGGSSHGGGVAWQETKQALVALGYSDAEVERIWPNVQQNAISGVTTDVLIKQALQALFKG
ncbi:MAG: Holliday junction branch migration protein RuvA [Paenibacillaceae bacterium]